MQAALSVYWQSLRDWYNGMVSLATLNGLWFGAALTVVLLAPATAGIYTVTHSTARGTGQHVEDFVRGAREHLWVSVRWLLANALVISIFLVNLTFYGRASGVMPQLILIALLSGGLLWLAMQLYVWPFLLVQEDQRLRIAFKNAAFLALASPLYTLTLLAGAALATVLSLATIAPLALFLISFLALLGNRAVLERLQTFGKLPGSAPPTPLDGEQL